MRKLISIVICLAVVFSVMGAFPAMAADTLVPKELLPMGNMESLGTGFASWDGAGTICISLKKQFPVRMQWQSLQEQ